MENLARRTGRRYVVDTSLVSSAEGPSRRTFRVMAQNTAIVMVLESLWTGGVLG